MEESRILQHFEGKTVLVTGATGFLAKIFVEKILRLQPNVKKLFLLMRASTKRSAEQRLQEEVLVTELFRVLREERGEEDFNSFFHSKVIPICGDITRENLGIVDADLREEMWQQIHIIVNSAATTNFDERYDVSFGINLMGAMHVQDFAIKCSKFEVLLHVSTAYVNGGRAGLVAEKPFRMGETLGGAKIPFLDINYEKHLIDEKLRLLQSSNLSHKEITRAMKQLGIERATLHGWPNTYVFTKAMGEMMLEKFKQKCNVIIIRPTIITSTFKDPFPGWIEGLKTMDSIFVAFGKAKMKFFVGDPESLTDLIPGDMVVNCMVAAIASHSKTKHDLIVYQVGSSRWNPVKFEELKWLMHRYVTRNPLLDSRGNPIIIGDMVHTLNTMASFHRHLKLHYMPYIKILGLINVICCNLFESACTNAERQINHTLRLAELYKPYLFSQEIFDDSNTKSLVMRMRGNKIDMEKEVLNFDPKCIMWDDYLLNTHFPGLVKYVLKK